MDSKIVINYKDNPKSLNSDVFHLPQLGYDAMCAHSYLRICKTKFRTDASHTRMLPVPKKYGLDQVTTRDSLCRYTGTPELWNVMIHPSGNGSVGGRPRPA